MMTRYEQRQPAQKTLTSNRVWRSEMRYNKSTRELPPETVKHLLACPSPFVAESRKAHHVDALANRFGRTYFFSLPFFYWMIDCFGHDFDGKETHSHAEFTQHYAKQARDLENDATWQDCTIIVGVDFQLTAPLSPSSKIL